jgi:hypothetical protein
MVVAATVQVAWTVAVTPNESEAVAAAAGTVASPNASNPTTAAGIADFDLLVSPLAIVHSTARTETHSNFLD